MSKPSRAEARRELRNAHKNLERVGKRDKHESAAFIKANRRVLDAEKNVPWWRR